MPYKFFFTRIFIKNYQNVKHWHHGNCNA